MKKNFAAIVGISMIGLAFVVYSQTRAPLAGKITYNGIQMTSSSQMSNSGVCGGSNGQCGGSCATSGWQCLWNNKANSCVCKDVTTEVCGGENGQCGGKCSVDGTSCQWDVINEACTCRDACYGTAAPNCTPDLLSSSTNKLGMGSSCGEPKICKTRDGDTCNIVLIYRNCDSSKGLFCTAKGSADGTCLKKDGLYEHLINL